MLKHLLPLIPAGLLVRQILPSPDGLIIVAASRAGTAACPDCGILSAAIHSRYERHLQDLPWQGRRVILRIQARRFRCRNPDCRRQTFAERLVEGAAGAARRTCRLADLQLNRPGFAGGWLVWVKRPGLVHPPQHSNAPRLRREGRFRSARGGGGC
ncbi:transposase family protein [Pseudoroseomonas sp. WGS1072]|uniref:transposase family protein n=1 Tax=Roseomonas sp. WGS1072 TaxID=3366816 RepID=UPI003BF0F456